MIICNSCAIPERIRIRRNMCKSYVIINIQNKLYSFNSGCNLWAHFSRMWPQRTTAYHQFIKDWWNVLLNFWTKSIMRLLWNTGDGQIDRIDGWAVQYMSLYADVENFQFSFLPSPFLLFFKISKIYPKTFFFDKY